MVKEILPILHTKKGFVPMCFCAWGHRKMPLSLCMKNEPIFKVQFSFKWGKKSLFVPRFMKFQLNLQKNPLKSWIFTQIQLNFFTIFTIFAGYNFTSKPAKVSDFFLLVNFLPVPTLAYTPSIVYKRHAIRDTSQIFEKNKRQRLVSAINLRDSWRTTF